MNNLWERLGYMLWSDEDHLYALCGGREYIWVYKNRSAIISQFMVMRHYQTPTGGFNQLQYNGPCGPITL